VWTRFFCLRIQTSKVKVKESRNRPGVTQRVPGGLGSQISWHSAHKGDEVVSLTHRPPLPPGMFLVLIFTRGWVDPRAVERSEGDMSQKNPVTPPGIDPGTVRLVAQHLNHYLTPGPRYRLVPWFKEYTIDAGSSIQGKQLPKCGIVTLPRRKLLHAVRKIGVSAPNISTEKLSSFTFWTQ
jgi:hypothetical protein